MNRVFFCASLSIIILSCQSTSQKSGNNQNSGPQTLESFADSMVRLNKFSAESIDVAADYYKRLVPADSALADSAAVMFLRHVNTVVDSTNQQLFNDTTDYFELVYNQSKNVPEQQKQFQSRLNKNHILLQGDGEGSVYTVPDYHWVNNVLQPKTSVRVDRYLSLLAKEEKAPTLLDAGLAIDMTELVDRLITSEGLAKEKLPRTFLEDVDKKKEFYTAVLLLGTDNTPAIDFNDLSLVEEFGNGYNYLLKTYPGSEAAKLVTEWQVIATK